MTEVNKYGVDENGVNHVNRYTYQSVGTANDINGYGGMRYYSNVNCRHADSTVLYDDCTSDYLKSDIKYVVDAWAMDNFKISDLMEDENGYKVRLLTKEDLITNLGYIEETSITYLKTENTPLWVYSSGCDYPYWTMSSVNGSNTRVLHIYPSGLLNNSIIPLSDGVVRPVINLYKKTIKKN